ncbi:MAG: protein-glutamate O-methyltransferase CheR [Eubacteriales bacterium]|nr:protein-glutamate O-methyltransferase CheR [Eubacteriales bacterium]
MLYLEDDEFNMIVSYMKTNYGISLERKRPLVEGRLGNHVLSRGFNNYKEYFEHAFKSKSNNELVSLINRLTTNHTYFLREKAHFEFYRDKILPWIDHTLKCKDLRVWSAGCSSGQEPYTLAMIGRDYFGSLSHQWDCTLLASDISDRALLSAKEGVYSSEELRDIPSSWMKKYFVQIDEEHYAVTDRIKNDVVYRNFNLLSPFQFKKPFHVILCRNVMIYFDTPTKNKMIDKFYQALLPGGYFLIGHSESLSSCHHRFKYIKPSIYQKAP